VRLGECLLGRLSVAGCLYFGTRIFVFPKMGRKQAPHSLTASSCLPNCIVKRAGRWVALSNHTVLLKDQADPVPVGAEEFIFQRHTVAARLRRS
jgi:hypothetical protein